MSAVDHNGTVDLVDAIAQRVADLLADRPTVTPDLIDSKGAADLLGVPASWIEREARAGRLPSVELGHYRRYCPATLREWWRSREKGPTR